MNNSRRTKIVCTLGPASSDPDMVRRLVQAGMNVARLNFSHGSHESHRRTYDCIRTTAVELGANVAIMMDLQGPKIRTGPMLDGKSVLLREGHSLTITTEAVAGTAGRVSTTYTPLAHEVEPGDHILVADGTIELRVESTAPPEIRCTVVRGGMLGSNKGINLPGVKILAPALTKKDREDLQFGIQLGVDYVALSFVRKPEDVEEVREIIEAAGAHLAVVAKIERPEALKCFEGILQSSDAIMIARGDLGVEMQYEDIPIVQKQLIHKCNEAGVPVITATQMLESMISHSRPTRAEATDVANAVYDGTDAVMLSGETASGAFPIESCEVIAKIAAKADEELTKSPPSERWVRLRTTDTLRKSMSTDDVESYADAIGQAVCRIASALKLPRIVCYTRSGYTAAAIARFRPAMPITAITSWRATMRRCALMWGVDALETNETDTVDQMVLQVDALLLENGLAKKGDTIIIVAGTPLSLSGRTNLLKLHTIGEEVG